jgi:hypothetical protein
MRKEPSGEEFTRKTVMNLCEHEEKSFSVLILKLPEKSEKRYRKVKNQIKLKTTIHKKAFSFSDNFLHLIFN